MTEGTTVAPGGLETALKLERPDDFYERLIAAHRGLSDAQSRQLNARLILLLANQVGDLAILEDALSEARRGLGPPASFATPPDAGSSG
ncbi:MAG: DUF2783 domain-containing protein [Alphaproteobacteria bacterium]|nr:DUF2783 domain-containing protein [Alphaproteobacteria bacterium]